MLHALIAYAHVFTRVNDKRSSLSWPMGRLPLPVFDDRSGVVDLNPDGKVRDAISKNFP